MSVRLFQAANRQQHLTIGMLSSCSFPSDIQMICLPGEPVRFLDIVFWLKTCVLFGPSIRLCFTVKPWCSMFRTPEVS